MKRREFLGKGGCGAAGLVAAPLVLGAQDTPRPVVWKKYAIEIEVIDLNGVTTEYIRCPDPSRSGIVVKITRTSL